MNIELAKKVYDHICTHRDVFDMEVWIETDCGVENPFDYTKHSCNTTACIAGWAVILSGKYTLDDTFEDGFVGDTKIAEIARKELELTPKQMNSLFFDSFEDTAIDRFKKAIDLAEKNELKDDFIRLDDEEDFNDDPFEMD
ncbi:MAG: hypothetical protein ACRC11_15505 [Xenococcaceae cyanobacterium]